MRILGICIIFVLSLLSSCKTLSGADAHRKIQRTEYNYEVRLARLESFTIKSLKEDIREAKKANKGKDKQSKKLSKLEQLKQELEEIKNENNN